MGSIHSVLGVFGPVNMSEVLTKVTRLAQEAAALSECELVDLQYVKEGREWFLRLFLERMGGDSPTIEDCVKVSDRLEGLLDVHDVILQAYRLEVSSPGVNRVLKKREDFIRFTGRLVAVKTYEAHVVGTEAKGRRLFKGHLGELEGELVVLMVDGQRVEIPLQNIAKANLELEF